MEITPAPPSVIFEQDEGLGKVCLETRLAQLKRHQQTHSRSESRELHLPKYEQTIGLYVNAPLQC